MNDPALFAEVFNEAADIIATDGWWNGNSEHTDGIKHCLWTAVTTAAERRRIGYFALHEGMLSALVRHFSVDDSDRDRGAGLIFALNDSQPPEEGQEWAVSHLRAAAAEMQALIPA